MFNNVHVNRFYRNKDNTKIHVGELKKWVEVYYQCNFLLFNEVKAMTPYKAKLMVLINILESGNIRSLYDHLTEATENSNHGSHANYQSHTMKDGGRIDRHTSSDFADLFQSYMNGFTLGIENEIPLTLEKLFSINRRQPKKTQNVSNVVEDECIDSDTAESDDDDNSGPPIVVVDQEDLDPPDVFFSQYFEIASKPVLEPRLFIGKKVDILRGLHFMTIGYFESG